MTEQRKLPEAGARKAYLNRYIKAGTHTVSGYEGAPDKDVPQIILGWELTEDFTDEEPPRPMWIKPFGIGAINDYDTDKAKKTQWFSSMFWEYDPEAKDAEKYLGRPCRVMVKHNPGKGKFDGITFANLAGVRDFEGELPPISQPPVFFDFYNPDKGALDNLFPWEVEFLQEAVDYPGSKLEAMIDGSESEVQEVCQDNERSSDCF